MCVCVCVCVCAGKDWPSKDFQTGDCKGFMGEEAEDGCQVPPGQMKTFLDIVTLDDFWDWMQV